MEKQEPERRRRVVLIPFPLQGHISPMLQLGSILHSRGFSITIVHTEYNSPDPLNHPEFVFLPISDNLGTSSRDPLDFISAVNKHCEESLEESLAQMMEKEEELRERITCIIYDSLMYLSAPVAHHLNLPSIMFRSVCAFNLLTYQAIPRLQKEGHLPFPDSRSEDLVPGLHPLRFKDLPLPPFGTFEDQVKHIELVRHSRTSSALICNTMDYLEYSALSQLEKHYQVPFFPIGPLHKLDSTSFTSLLKEDTNCIHWLNKQAPRSVIYVSLGSVATINKKDITEMAWGIANSDQPFLWVVRPGSVHGSEWDEFLPKGFKEKVGERGCIVKWAPQKDVLAHGAVGGFWSHCGWNSTLESISEGVPMICRPCFGDQKVNSRYLSCIWRVGLEVEHVLNRGEIERATRRLMVDKEGEEMRKKAIDMKNDITVSVQKGGSSYNSLDDLEEFILSL